jgi:hypothetical protein
MKIEEMQLGLQTVTTFLDTWTKNLSKEVADTKKDRHKHDFRLQGTQVKIEITRTQAETTWHKF